MFAGSENPATSLLNVLVAATSYDLLDLATAKAELKISDDSADAWLSGSSGHPGAISQISAAISAYCNRVFLQETVQDIVYPARYGFGVPVRGDRMRLRLSRWPVATNIVPFAVSAAVSAGVAILPVSSVTGLSVGQPAGGCGAADVLAEGTTIAEIDASASTVTLSAALLGQLAAGASLWAGPVVRARRTGGVTVTLDPSSDYLLDGQNGFVTRLNPSTGYPISWPEVRSCATYQGGFSSPPGDVVDAALRLLTQRASGRDRDPMLKSREQPGLGTETYWVGSAPGVKGPFPSEIAALLDNYRVPVVA